ncbi:MAG TPA: hypothetical protein VMI33_27615 [Streptosporangiaceae bacterium]|nr:hypothetical protein [Streptosporangiaceae bacterium]
MAGPDGGGPAEYDDGRVACTGTGLLIRHYYFPLGSKHVPYTTISEVRQIQLGAMGRWRIHGSNDFIHWFNFDPRRPRKQAALVVYTHGQVRPVITPDDPDQVAVVLASHGVNVTSRPEPGLY